MRALPHRQTVPAGAVSTNASPRLTFSAGQIDEASSVTAYRGVKVFSYVVLALMLAAIAYASTIAVIYWTGISV